MPPARDWTCSKPWLRSHMVTLRERAPWWQRTTMGASGSSSVWAREATSPMGEVASRAHTELDPDAPIVVLCHHGARSLSVTMWLRSQGFEQVQSLAGGIDAWSRTIDPTVP